MPDNSNITARWRRLRRLPAIIMTAAALACISGHVTSCNTQGCTDNRSALPLAGFYSSATGSSIIIDSLAIGGVGAPDDSLLLKAGEKVYNIYLPFRSDRQTTSFFCHYDYPSQGLDNPALNDTLTFRYTSTPYFASEECGAYYVYTLTGFDYTRHLIDSVAIVDSVFNNVEMERIKIFFRTIESDNPDPDNPEEPDMPDDNGDADNPDNPETETGTTERRAGR